MVSSSTQGRLAVVFWRYFFPNWTVSTPRTWEKNVLPVGSGHEKFDTALPYQMEQRHLQLNCQSSNQGSSGSPVRNVWIFGIDVLVLVYSCVLLHFCHLSVESLAATSARRCRCVKPARLSQRAPGAAVAMTLPCLQTPNHASAWLKMGAYPNAIVSMLMSHGTKCRSVR